MAKSGWKILFSGLICILTVLAVLGCAQKPSELKTGIDVSSRYYAVKEPTERDLKVLKELLSATDSGKYGLLIGGYYYKNKETEKAKIYLEKYYNYSEDSILNVFKNAWLGNIYLEEDKIKAIKYYIKADNYKGSDEFNFAISYLCKKNYESFLDCYKGRLEKEERKITAEEEIKLEKPAPLIIKERRVKSLSIKDASTTAINGILFLIDLMKIDIEVVKNAKDFDYEITGDNILIEKDKSIDFSFKYKDIIDDALSDEIIKNSKLVFIVTNDKSAPEAQLLKSKLDNMSIKNEIANFETGTLKSKYEAITKENLIDTNEVAFIALKDYNTILNAVPYIKFVSKDPKKTNVVAISDIIDNRIVSSDYYSYFKGVKIYTFLDISKKEVSDLQSNYYDYFKEYPSVKQYLLYDMLSYVNETNNFITGITDIKENKVKRVNTCIVVKYLKIEKCMQTR